MVLTQICCSRLKQSKISLLFPHTTFGAVLYFFCQFWVYLGINSLSQRISKIDESKKFKIFDIVFKLEFEVKN